MGNTVEVRLVGRVAVVTIVRPERRNAVDPATARALFDACVAAEADTGVDALVLTGAGGTFCAGFDLKTAADGSALDWIRQVDIPDDWSDPMAEPIAGPMGPSRLMLRKPVIAAVEGHAVAGGMELALWCDMRVVSQEATFGVFCRRWGVPLIDGGTVRLPRIVGQGRANDLILTGRPLGAREADNIGLADRVVAQGTALASALKLAEIMGEFPQGCMQADHLSARMAPADLAAGLRREWASAVMFAAEGQAGAARFAGGAGRGGRFDDL